MSSQIDQLTVDTMRNLTVDAVQKANHGHLGMPLGTAPMGYTLWKYFLNVNPKDDKWFNRDRFVLSAGHGSMLLYSLMHLSGFPLTIDDIKSFRQLHSKTPGHPELDKTAGVDVATGPLGQGFAMGVGLAIAEAHLGERYNKPKYPVIDHYTYVVSGDGDFEEGVCQESASVAGNLGLNKLIVLWDANHVTSDGPLSVSNNEDEIKKFEAMNWNVLEVKDGNNIDEIKIAITRAKESSDKPTLIKVNTTIGFGSTLQGTSAIHSDPVSEEEAQHMKKEFGFADKPDFFVPKEVKAGFTDWISEKESLESSWTKLLTDYALHYPKDAKELTNLISGGTPLPNVLKYEVKGDMATRAASGNVLNKLYKDYPYLVGGSGDLGTSNKTTIQNEWFMSNQRYAGPNIYFGVREFAMGAIMNGLTLHGGLRGYTGTFLVFSDYMRSSIRHAAIMNVPTIFTFTHDSLYVGQDGPTHQPVEHLMSLRAMPNLTTFRAADAHEVKAAWTVAMESERTPVAIILNRQSVPELRNSDEKKALKGGYIISKAKNNNPVGIIIATGSEVSLALETQQKLEADDVFVQVVSLPSWELFENQSDEYKESVLPTEIKNRMSIELGATMGWEKYVGIQGIKMGYDHFGESAPADDIISMIDFTSEHAKLLYLKHFV